MTTKQALEVVTQEEAVAKLENRGYKREPCDTCKGIGHRVGACPEIGLGMESSRTMHICTKCDGNGYTWRAPLVR